MSDHYSEARLDLVSYLRPTHVATRIPPDRLNRRACIPRLHARNQVPADKIRSPKGKSARSSGGSARRITTGIQRRMITSWPSKHFRRCAHHEEMAIGSANVATTIIEYPTADLVDEIGRIPLNVPKSTERGDGSMRAERTLRSRLWAQACRGLHRTRHHLHYRASPGKLFLFSIQPSTHNSIRRALGHKRYVDHLFAVN